MLVDARDARLVCPFHLEVGPICELYLSNNVVDPTNSKLGVRARFRLLTDDEGMETVCVW